MRIATVLAVILCIPLIFVYAADERIILSDFDSNLPPVQKLASDRSHTELEFGMAGIEVTPTIAADGVNYQSIAPIASVPERFGETGEEGLPELPLYSQLIAIPDQAGVRLEILSAQYETLEGYIVMPSQPSPVEGSSEISAFTKDEVSYLRNEYYPPDPIALGEPLICRDLRMIQTVIYPVQYNPVTRQLRVYTHIDYRLTYEGTDSRNAKVRRDNRISETFLPMYRALVLNADEMLADYQPVRAGYLIITPNAYADTVKVFERWKHLKGYYTKVTKATDIDPDGILSSAQVFTYIQTAYVNWENPPEFVCIVGDENVGIPDYPFGTYASDHRYSCVDGDDYLSDVMVTRMSIYDQTTMRTAMYKAIKYENNPYMGDPNYWLRGLSVAANAYAVTPRLTTLWVRQELLRHGYIQVDTSFIWGTGGSDPLLAGYFNNGVSIISYRGWAAPGGWYAPSFTVTDLNNLHQTNKMGIMASLVCGTGDFGSPECFGEKWIRMGTLPDSLKGGPCFYGVTDPSTHTKWNNPIMIGYYWALFEQGVYNFASAAFLGKMEQYNTYPRHQQPGGWVERYFHTYNTLGDPELEMRLAIPQTMTVTYPATIPTGTSMLTVHVNGSGGAPLANAYVNLVKGYGVGEQVFVGGRTNASGDMTLNFAATTADTMFVTVTARDYIPHKGFTLVQNQAVALNISAIAISDDNIGGSSGNNDGNVNPSETVEFAITLRNFGTSTTATNVSATLASVDPDVNITIPTQTYPNIAPGATGNAGQFAAHFAADIPRGERRILRLNITSTQGSWTAAVPVDIKSMSFAVTSLAYPGDPNNRFDPGETSSLVVNLVNHGELAGTSIVGHLSSDDASVVITDSLADFGNIGIEGSGSNAASPFSVLVTSGVYPGHNINFDLILASTNGSTAQRSFSAVVGTVTPTSPIGPDDYGYYLYDNTDVDYLPSPIYSWAEISPFAGGSGTRISYGNTDDSSAVITLPFNFVYYGQPYSYLLVSINGFVAFDTSRMDDRHPWFNFDNGQIPEPGAPGGLIAPFWDDLEYTGNNGVFRYYDNGNHRFIIEWKNCTHALGNHSPESFQMIIYDPAYHPTPTGDAEIIFQYELVNNDDNDTYDSEAPGMYCTVGMQNMAKTDGLQYTYDNLYHPAAVVLAAGRAIKITTATGIAPPPDLSYSPASFFKTVPAGQFVRDTLTIANVGAGGLAFTLIPVTDNRIASDENDGKSGPGNEISPTSGPPNPPIILNQGGPDAYGYHWIDSDEPGGPAAAWIDISAMGTLVPLTDDSNAGPFNIGFVFPYYENLYTQLFIGSNGFVSFVSGSNSNSNVLLPNASAPNNFLPAFWDDINPGAGGTVRYYYDSANQRFIVSFDNVPFYNLGGSLDIQIVLYPNGYVMYNYGTLDIGSGTLTSCTVGIENDDGTIGLTVINNAAYLHNNLSILFTPPPRWLTTNLLGGVLGNGADTFAVITFDATDLDPGVYTGHIDLDSNDPDEGSIDIPLTLTVGGQGAPDIAFYPDALTDTLSEGQFVAQTLKVYNRGTANLRVNLSAIEFNLTTNEKGPVPASAYPAPVERIARDILNNWLFISPAADTIPPGDSLMASVTFDARFVGAGLYSGEIRMASNDPDSPNLTAPATFLVSGSGPNCQYVPGDINDNGAANGIDVVFGVNYLKGGSAPPYSCDCASHGILYVAGDVNGNCAFNGIDITFFVAYLKGLQPALRYCVDCAPSRQSLISQPAPAAGN